MTRRLALAAVVAVALAGGVRAQSLATALTCATDGSEPNGHIAWPVASPLWEFDFYRPANKTTPQGTGLELRNVTYQGHKVFERASVPVLNVEYDAGGCGCYRDWQFTEATFEATDAATGAPPAPGLCFDAAAAGSVVTTCERSATGPAPDAGAFKGVTVEDYGSELVLTTHMRAGWYRYRMKWHFYADGRIWPEYSFASAPNTCTANPRRHHAYWRFDFDLDNTPSNDVVTEVSAATGTSTTIATESNRTWAADPSLRWTVVDAVSHVGYSLEPGPDDLTLPVDPLSKTDVLVLRYRTTEIDDGLEFTSGCAFQFEPWLDGETVSGKDVVLWYRSSSARTTGTCELRGPTLRRIGFAVALGDGPDPTAAPVEVQAARPNPFTPQTSVRFRVAQSQDVRVVLYDALGRRVRTLFEAPVEAGVYETVEISGAGLTAGTYVVRVERPPRVGLDARRAHALAPCSPRRTTSPWSGAGSWGSRRPTSSRCAGRTSGSSSSRRRTRSRATRAGATRACSTPASTTRPAAARRSSAATARRRWRPSARPRACRGGAAARPSWP